jgi:HIRAN domain-containing protein
MRDACEVLRLHPLGEFPVACVGESHYQDALEIACGSRKEDGENREVTAVLSLEDSNPYDSDAVRVEVHGRTVGYLNRQDARAYRELLNAIGCSEELECRGLVRGGWDRGPRDRGYYGIYLDLPIYE